MHDTAAAFGAAFFRCYADTINGARILDIGAADVNGTLRGSAPFGSQYTGIDVSAGPGVDLVLNDPYDLPFDTASFDVVVSSSCLEHDPMFWLTFTEMCRVLRTGGFIYLNVPSNGYVHRYPTDNWRFYPGAGVALAAWGRRNGHDLNLVESFIGRRRHDVWNDCVMVFGKGKTPRPLQLLTEVFSRSFNIRIGEDETYSNFCEPTEDMTLRAWLIDKLAGLPEPNGEATQPSPMESLIVALAEREAALDADHRVASERSAAAEAQLTALREEIAELMRDREDHAAELVTALESTQVELAQREAALAVALQRAEELGERLRAAEAMRDTELVTLRADLGKRALEVQDLRDVVAGSRAEAAAQRAAFVRARQETTERDAAARQEAAECGTVIAQMRGEIASLSERLASARQIGPTIGQLFNNLRFLYKKKLIILADRARGAGQWDVAAHYYRRALDRNPKRLEIWIQYGHVLKEAGRLWAAEQAYRRATAEAPAAAEPYRYLGDVLSAQRKRDEAVVAYLQAHSLDPASPDALSGLRKLGWSEKDLVAGGHISDRTN